MVIVSISNGRYKLAANGYMAIGPIIELAKLSHVEVAETMVKEYGAEVRSTFDIVDGVDWLVWRNRDDAERAKAWLEAIELSIAIADPSYIPISQEEHRELEGVWKQRRNRP